MGLDILLRSHEPVTEKCICSSCDNEHEHTYYPELWSGHITHNLATMAEECELYLCIWRPEELNITEAGYLVYHLDRGLMILEEDPKHFSQFNAKNGCGNYASLLSFAKSYRDACIKYPNARIYVWR